jgi:3-deoxy-D-manno-octulosonate 8-phosphate phosphatase (KDO 8-P phosphatase)
MEEQPSVFKIFEDIGGKFHIPEDDFRQKSAAIRNFVFDWDGVFTDGRKMHGGQSSFSEIDSMGLNLLRFGWYLLTGDVPFFAIITGLNNATAIEFARREHFDTIFMGFMNKKLAFDYLQDNYPVTAESTAYFFDDVLDLCVCAEAGMRLMMQRRMNPGFNGYVEKHQLADYSASVSGGHNGLRECSELLLMTTGIFEEAMDHRTSFSQAYVQYWEMRQRIQPRSFVSENGQVKEISLH